MPTEFKTIAGKQILILDLEEPAAICAARAYATAIRSAKSVTPEQLQICSSLEQITNARVGKENHRAS